MLPEKKNLSADEALDPVVSLSAELVAVPSVTAIDEKDYPASVTCLDLFISAAKAMGAEVHRLSFSGDHPKWGYPVDNVYLEWRFGDAARHLCYIGHLDVVPPGDESLWSSSPFSARLTDGYIYGRGITDMKGSVAAFLSAIPAMKESNLCVSMIVTMDEEWAAVNGTKKVLAWTVDNGKKPDAFIVGEPSSQDILGTHVKIGRRGSLVGRLVVKGTQGHAAYKDLFENPNRALTLAAAILNSRSFNDGDENFPNTNFECVAMKSGDFNASAVIPGSAEMLWNIRFTPDHTPDSLEKWINDSLRNPPDWARTHPDFELLKNIFVVSNTATASVPYRSKPAVLAESARQAIKRVLNIDAKFDGSGGTTDGRFVQQFFPEAEIIELGLPERGGIANGSKPADYLTKGGMHQVDERASIQDLINLKKLFHQTVINYDRLGNRNEKAAAVRTAGKNIHP